ncbi:hypothetical protein JB92DRAFT_2992299 [Gautieria morchelliformis]|nr:hypothetical protein JB92DRAFT_2992299 [Gautieria morchelliformis]
MCHPSYPLTQEVSSVLHRDSHILPSHPHPVFLSSDRPHPPFSLVSESMRTRPTPHWLVLSSHRVVPFSHHTHQHHLTPLNSKGLHKHGDTKTGGR